MSSVKVVTLMGEVLVFKVLISCSSYFHSFYSSEPLRPYLLSVCVLKVFSSRRLEVGTSKEYEVRFSSTDLRDTLLYPTTRS